MVDLRLRLRDGGVASPSPLVVSVDGPEAVVAGREARVSKKDGMPSARSVLISLSVMALMPTITTDTRRSVSVASGSTGSVTGDPGLRLLEGRDGGKCRC